MQINAVLKFIGGEFSVFFELKRSFSIPIYEG